MYLCNVNKTKNLKSLIMFDLIKTLSLHLIASMIPSSFFDDDITTKQAPKEETQGTYFNFVTQQHINEFNDIIRNNVELIMNKTTAYEEYLKLLSKNQIMYIKTYDIYSNLKRNAKKKFIDTIEYHIPLDKEYYDDEFQKTVYKKSNVYAMIDNTGRVKIGKANNVEKRLSQLRTANPDIKLLYKKEVITSRRAKVLENTLHGLFKNSHYKLEWYTLDKEDLENLHDILS